jgi:hypothetical protein
MPTRPSGNASASPRCTASTRRPIATANTAGSSPCSQTTAHQVSARPRSAFGSAAKKSHSFRSRSRRNIVCLLAREIGRTALN